METFIQLARARAFRESRIQALANNAEYQLYRLTPSGSGKDDLARSLLSSSAAFRELTAADQAIAEMTLRL